MFTSDGWKKIEARWRAGGTLHLIGLLSDGGVHSRLDQIFGVIDGAASRGCKKIRIHALFDGRDVPDGTSTKYIADVEQKAAEVKARGVDLRIASGGGRMFVTMDRYESDWSIVERGWNTHVLGEAKGFASATEAIAAARSADGKMSDQHLPPFVVVDAGKPIGTIEDGDAVVFCNFRGDRALQITRAFEEKDFKPFDRKRVPKVLYCGMMEYDGDLHLPRHYLVSPPTIERTSGEFLAHAGIRTFACSETQKYGHVTYFWNGNRSGKFDDEKEVYVEVPSNLPPFEAKPAMKAPEIAAAAAEAVRSGKFDVVRVNLANGDMVGHTGDLNATIASCAAADVALGTMIDAVNAAGGVFIVTADHGNADDMALRDKKGVPLRGADGAVLPKTSHTLAPVPFCLGGNGLEASVVLRADLPSPGLANIAATLMAVLGFTAPADYEPSLLKG